MGISDVMDSGDIWAAVAELQRQLRTLTSGRRLESASIGSGDIRLIDEGSLTINGGSLRMTDETTEIGLVYFGPNDFGIRTWLFSFDDGEVAFGLNGVPGSTYWVGRDRDGNVLISSDRQGIGLGKPYLSYDLIPTEDAEQSGTSMWPSTTATSAGTAILARVVPIHHPRLCIGATVTTTGGGTGHWRATVQSSTASHTVVSDETGFSRQVVDVPGWGDEIVPGEEITIGLEAWVTGGGTRAFIQYDRLYAMES